MTGIRTILTLCLMIVIAAPAAAQNPHELFQEALRKERADGDLPAAIALYARVANGDDRALAARALLRIGDGYERLGRPDAREAYQRVMRDFPDQAEPVKAARGRLAALLASNENGGIAGADLADESDLRLRLVWEDPGVDTEGQPTSDGRYLTFVDWETGDLAVRDLVAGTHRLITKIGYPQYALQSAVSNDDRRVAYFWTAGENDSWRPQLRVIGMDGTGERTLIANDNREIEYLAPYAWTPDDGQVLALLTRAGSWDITLTDVATAEVRVVRSLTKGTSSRLTMSPDGRWIAYDQAVDRNDMFGDRDIYVVAADGSRSFTVVQHPATDLHPVFTPDGRHLVFTSDRGGSVDLWAVAVGENGPRGEPKLLKRGVGAGSFLMGFDAGGTLFYARDTGGGDVFAAPFDARTLRLTGEGQKRVQSFEGYNTAPGWSRDGSRIAYTSRRNEISAGQGAALFIRDARTGREIESKGSARYHRKWTRPVFSPDGRTLIANGQHRGEPVVAMIDAETGQPRRIDTAPSPGGVGVAGWAPDGAAFYYISSGARNGAREHRLLRQEIATGEATEVLKLGPEFVPGTAALSPDGRQLAWGALEGHRQIVRVRALGGGPVRDLYESRSPVDISQAAGIAWTPNSKHLLFAISRNEGWVANKTREVMAVPVQGGDPIPTGLAASELRHLSVLADGSAIGYAAGPQAHAEIWVIENLLTILRGK